LKREKNSKFKLFGHKVICKKKGDGRLAFERMRRLKRSKDFSRYNGGSKIKFKTTRNRWGLGFERNKRIFNAIEIASTCF
jgi:hypothetical protein